ncbi:MAG TPA: DUF1592 domain-containing protein [Pirellulaceae bacterium]|nr:DUF1592 domain-containing protein [Pirellulaceae bacterium]
MILRHLLPFSLAAALALPAPAEETKTQVRNRELKGEIGPLLAKYCTECHGKDEPQADFAIVGVESVEQMLGDRKRWLTALAKVQGGEMPPEEAESKPTAGERKRLAAWLDDALHNLDCEGSPDPGRVTLRRLNRREYRNTIRDLVGIDYELAMDFPGDDSGYGFDNIGDVLTMPPVLLEKYLDAAEQIAEQAIDADGGKAEFERMVEGQELSGDGSKRGAAHRILTSNGEAHYRFDVPQSGKYAIYVAAGGEQAGDEQVKMGVMVDGKEVGKMEVRARASQPQEYVAHAQLEAGQRRIGAAFLNDFYDPDGPDPQRRDRNLILASIRVRGPLDRVDLPPSHKQIIFINPEEVDRQERRRATEQILRKLITRAFRRPPTDEEMKRYSDLAFTARRQGESLESSVQLILQALLVSPHFLYKMELDPPGKEGQPRDLSDFEVASRLSYFLWSSMPDDELFELAAQGKLKQDGNLEKQVRRMLASPKSKALAENFAGQWLQLRSLEIRTPDGELFPAWNDDLRRAMRTETELFFDAVVREDRSILDLLAADFTFVNEPLAKHYGLSGVSGSDFRRVSTAGTPRGGLLAQASFLTITSNPNRTSPVKRGKWILENILGTPPPPPPPDVPELAEAKKGEDLGSLRARLEEHRVNPACASCHERMDPLGFAMENFDAIGAWRDKDGKSPIDPSGKLPSGESFRGATELRDLIVKSRQNEFLHCLAEKLLTYALGRGLEYYDQCAVDTITKAVREDGHKFSRLVLGIVHSDPFLKTGASGLGPPK